MLKSHATRGQKSMPNDSFTALGVIDAITFFTIIAIGPAKLLSVER